MQVAMIRKIAKGEFVKRKANSVKVYIRGDYDKATKTFTLTDFNDISREMYVKANSLWVVGFEF